ncbi:hypothetical protein SH139x_000597 [Planctomycetaceae bacterium SH139]
MAGAFAASLGAIALATVILRGTLAGEAAVDCIRSGIGALFGFAILGWLAGSIMDYLVRQDIENQYRRRLDWFRSEFQSTGDELPTTDELPRPDA